MNVESIGEIIPRVINEIPGRITMNQVAQDYSTKEEWLAARALDVTSTDVAAIMGFSPYKSLFQLYHEKKNNVYTEIEEHERMKWGTRLQPGITAGLAEDFKIENVIPVSNTYYVRVPDLRIGTSLDNFVGEDEIFEIKNVDFGVFSDGWKIDDEGNLEAPLHIEMQVQHQLLVTGRKRAMIGALVGGNRGVLLHREAQPDIHEAILAKTADFWEMVDQGNEPAPDFSRDSEFIIGLMQKVGGVPITADEEMSELAEQYDQAKQEADEAESRKQSIKAQLLMKIGDAPKVNGNGFSISCGMVKGSTFTVTKDPYRMMRIYWKKGK